MEGRYLREFCNHYLQKLKFDEIVLYDNNAYGKPMSPLEQEDQSIMSKIGSPQIKVIHRRNLVAQQLKIYNEEIQRNRNTDSWIAFFDADEFLVLKKHKNIHDFIKSVATTESIGAIAVNWYMFGTSGKKCYENIDVTKRFTTRMAGVDQHIKSIVRPSKVSCMQTPHNAIFIGPNYAVDASKHKVSGPWHKSGSADIAVLHHYWTKSEEEFHQKISRGLADRTGKRNPSQIMDVKDAVITDTSAQTPVLL
jgi:hypothetical protein